MVHMVSGVIMGLLRADHIELYDKNQLDIPSRCCGHHNIIPKQHPYVRNWSVKICDYHYIHYTSNSTWSLCLVGEFLTDRYTEQ